MYYAYTRTGCTNKSLNNEPEVQRALGYGPKVACSEYSSVFLLQLRIQLLSGPNRTHFGTRICHNFSWLKNRRNQNLVSFGENAVRAIFFDRRISGVKIWGSTNDNRENRVAILLKGIFARIPSTSREKQGKPAELKR